MLTAEAAVKDLMTRRVVTIGMDDTLQTARKLFREKQIHHLVVLENGEPVGVISDRDVMRNISPYVGVRFSEQPKDTATLRKRVHQVMTRRLFTVTPDDSAIKAGRVMLERSVSCLPVLNTEGNLVGILTSRDLLRWTVETSRA